MSLLTIKMADEERLRILDSLKIYVNQKEKELNSITKSLGWNMEHIREQNTLRKNCLIDTSHLIGPSKMKDHLEHCEMSKYKYNRSDKMLPDCSSLNYQKSVQIDTYLCKNIISNATKNDINFVKDNSEINRPMPLSYEQLISLYTSDERRALYDYVLSQTKSSNESLDRLNLSQSNDREWDKDKQKSILEDLAMMRDVKRRRTKYKVSTKSKSYKEILRGVVGNLMASYEEDVKAQLHKRKRQNRDDATKKKYKHSDYKHSTKHHKR